MCFVTGKSLFYGGDAGPLWNMLPYEQSVVLNAKGNGEAKVTLAAVPGVTSEDYYEIILKTHAMPCQLKFNGKEVDFFVFTDQHTLSVSKYFTFWIAWKQGMVEAGSGSTVGLGRFLGWRNPTPIPVRGLTVNTDVFWRFDSDSGWCYENCVYFLPVHAVYPKKYAHGFVVLCFVVVMQSFIMNSHEIFIHIHQGCFAGTGAIVRLPQCQWSKPDGYGKISQCITTTKHSKAKTVCIFLGIYCRLENMYERTHPLSPFGWEFIETWTCVALIDG